MATYYIYSKFDKYNNSGFSFSVMNEEDHGYFKDAEDFTFVKEVELQDPNMEDIVKAGVRSIDKDIAELQMKITQQEEKKQQLLAITYQEEV